jgi:hypothetical protein
LLPGEAALQSDLAPGLAGEGRVDEVGDLGTVGG